MLIAADGEIARYWQGGPPRDYHLLILSCDGARGYHLLISSGSFGHREGSGPNPVATSQRILRALIDVRSFQSGLHLLAWKSGDWPVIIVSAHTAISLGWILNYLFSFAGQVPTECGHHSDLLPISSDEGEAQSAKRERELTK